MMMKKKKYKINPFIFSVKSFSSFRIEWKLWRKSFATTQHSTAQFRVYMCIGISAVDDDNVDDNIEVYFLLLWNFIFLC